jgi:hypothetical protein
MGYTERSDTTGWMANSIEALRTEYEEYYSSLIDEELQPQNIILCSALTAEKYDTFEKVLLIYSDKIIVLKKVNGCISKHKVENSNINCVTLDGLPSPGSITIHYKNEGREKIFFDPMAMDVIKILVNGLRKNIIQSNYQINEIFTQDKVTSNKSISYESEYIGTTLAVQAMLEDQTKVCILSQRRVYDRYWSIFRKVITQTHYTIVCSNEIIIFLEKYEPRDANDICGDLIFIPVSSVKSVSLEAAEKGMIMKYMFYSDKTFELFYDNERTDELLKVMSYINGVIQA